MITRIHPIFLALLEAARSAPDDPGRSTPAIRPLGDHHQDILSGWRIRRLSQLPAGPASPAQNIPR